jgi:hypothetical protein
MANSYFGYSLRRANKEETLWFEANRNISGYASNDRFIVISPFSTLNEKEIEGVCVNEAIRLFMWEHQINPQIELTQKQINYFKGTAYENKDNESKQTIIARIISGDPSALDYTDNQKNVANEIYKLAVKN